MFPGLVRVGFTGMFVFAIDRAIDAIDGAVDGMK